MKNWQKTILVDLIALLLGVTATLSFAPFELWPLALLAAAGLLYLWLDTKPKKAFWLGYVFGAGLFGSGIYWVYHSIHVFGGVPAFPAVLFTALLIAYLALYPGLTGYCLNKFFPQNTMAKLVFAFPAIWVFMDWLRSFIATGFPWLFFGYSQTNSPLKGFAPILSVYGVTFALIMCSGLSVHAFLQYKKKELKPASRTLLTIIAIFVTGTVLMLIPWTKNNGKVINLSLVQGNIPQAVKWDPKQVNLSLDRYAQLTLPILKKDQVIIWPEAAVPLPMQTAFMYLAKIDHLATVAKTNMAVGVPIQLPSGKFLNAIVTLGSGPKQYYGKRLLVPFGEYTPTIPLLSNIMNVMKIPMSDMVPGDLEQQSLILNNIKVLPAICYEIAFPDLMRAKDKDIGMLLTVTNDAWFGNSSASAQHLQMARMRAIEFKRPLVFVGNDAMTAIVNANGDVVALAPKHQTFVLQGQVRPMFGLTPWMNNGSDFILFIIIFSLVYAYRVNKLSIKTETELSPTMNNAMDEKI